MTHSEAAAILRQAWKQVHGRDPSASELLFAQAIALLETGYGRSGQFGALAAQGKYNWGALERRRVGGACPPGTEPGSDQGAVCFLVFDSDELAAAAFLRNLTTRHWPVLRAMRGSATDVARAMRVSPAYYTGTAFSEDGKVREYATAIENAARAIGSPLAIGGGGFPWLLAAGAVGLGYAGYRFGWWDEALRSARKIVRT